MLNITDFLKQTRAELEKVTWPTKDQTIRLTGVVLLVSLIVSFYLGILDYVFNQMLKFVLSIQS